VYQFIDAEGAAEALQGPFAVAGHVEGFGVLAEAVVDEPVGKLQEEVPPQRGAGGLDAHTVVEDAIEHGLADRVVVAVAEADARRVGPEGRTATASGAILAITDVEVGDPAVFEGADPADEDLLAPPGLAASRTGGFARRARDRYVEGVGPSGSHRLRAPVGRLSTRKRAGFRSPRQ
jgi:hypothetical protein